MLTSSAPRSLLTHAGSSLLALAAVRALWHLLTDFITDVYMKRVAADPKLRDFANNAK